MTELPELIRSERLALVDFLEVLTPEDWATPSLCGAWTVQEVAAHLAWAPASPVHEAFADFARSGFRVNKSIADSAVRWSRRGTGAILEQLRSNAESGTTPIGLPKVAGLVDAVVHPLDIRHPLGRPRPIPQEAFTRVADFLLAQRWPLTLPTGGSARRRVAGLRLVATDLDWSHGEGPEVHGAAEALMRLLAARRVEPDELSGPGATAMYARL